MTDAEDTPGGPFWCPWCEAVITLDGEPVTEGKDAYWHTYDHRDKASDAVVVLDEFLRLNTVTADEQANMKPPRQGEKEATDS